MAPQVKITVDTNVLVRVVVRDDVQQTRIAEKFLREAELMAVTLSSLCELVWVLRQGYKFGHGEIAVVLETLLNAENVAVNRPAVDAGLAVLNAGGDFADGVIAYEGRWLGGDTFVSFDKKAVSLIAKQGQRAKLLT